MVLPQKPAGAKTAGRERELATRRLVFGAVGAPAQLRTPASARERNRNPAKLVTVAERKRAR